MAEIMSLVNNVSIHAPTWGATPHFRRDISGQGVSIHAPTWGATGYMWAIIACTQVSIHAPTWGATDEIVHKSADLMFQSTLPHGERHIVEQSTAETGSFNPRSHMGSD